MFGLFAVTFLCSLAGILIFAKYYNCDPTSLEDVVSRTFQLDLFITIKLVGLEIYETISLQVVSSSDQLLPLFVMDVLGHYPGLPGLLVAGLTCGSLRFISPQLCNYHILQLGLSFFK